MGQKFDQTKCDNTFWPMPNILHPSVIKKLVNNNLRYLKREFKVDDVHCKSYWNDFSAPKGFYF